MSSESYDYIIVGAGSAGCVVANRLTASGEHNVLLLESGGPDKGFWIPIPLGMTRLINDPRRAWLDPTVPTRSFANRSMTLTQGRMLGGTSSLNGMIYVRGHRDDYDAWAANGCPGWSWEDVLPYYKRAESLENSRPEYHGHTGELKLSWIREIHPSSEAFIRAAQEALVPFNEDYNSGNHEGVGYIQGTIYKGQRQSTSATFLKAAQNRSNLRVETGAHVRRVVFENRRAVGIELASGEIIGAKSEVILSAGAIGTPHILQHSGVGDGLHLRSLGIEVVLDAPEVGGNLQDHLFGHMKYRAAAQADSMNRKLTNISAMGLEMLRWLLFGTGMMNTITAQTIGFIKSSVDLPKPDIQLTMRPFSFHVDKKHEPEIDSFPGIMVSAINVQPYSRGEVKIESADPSERAKVHTNYLSDHRDIEALSNGIAKLREIMKQSAIASIATEEIEPGATNSSPEALESYLRDTASTVYHPAGTCRMGSDDGAVVDPQLRSRGLDGLRVIDASVMPNITSGNTNAPSIMIGEKGSDLVLADAR